jgi:predicted phage tail protein
MPQSASEQVPDQAPRQASETLSETLSAIDFEPGPASLAGNSADYGQRDAASLRMLGFFFAILGTLVLIGTFWSLDNARAIIVNVASGGMLVAVGVGMLVLSRRTGARPAELHRRQA